VNQKLRLIYVVEALPDPGSAPSEVWQVALWEQHPALLPVGLEKQVVSTEAGDADLLMPWFASRDRSVVIWAFAEVRRMHPKATDLDALDTLSLADQLTLTLDLALEYVGLAEEGRGHNERSHYLARALRQIAAKNTSVCPSVTPIESEAGLITFEGDAL
jgi:hypothetical protein